MANSVEFCRKMKNWGFYREMKNSLVQIKESIAGSFRKHMLPVLCVGALILVLCIVTLVRAFWDPHREEVRVGTEYLKELESRDIATVEADVKSVQKQSMIKAIEAGEIPLWAQFSDCLIFGDSRSVGFTFYEFLDSQRVIAEAGYTILNIEEHEEKMATLNPSYLFLCTGLNDEGIGLWNTPEEYVAAYEEVMQQLTALLPNTEIYINSIFPAEERAFEKNEKWREIPEYNEALKAWCEEKGYHFIDNTQVYEEHSDLYDQDGIHFQKDFYQYWAMNMLAEVDG